MGIYLIQLLCPNRHAVVAVSYDETEMPHDVARAIFEKDFDDMVAHKILRRECGICKSTTLNYECAKTKYKTMEEASRELSKLEAENLASRALLDEINKANRN